MLQKRCTCQWSASLPRLTRQMATRSTFAKPSPPLRSQPLTHEQRLFTSYYRESLRMLLRFQHPHLQRKLHANLREVYEVLRLPQKTFTVQERLQNAKQTADLLRMWSHLPAEQQKGLFEQPFSTS